MTRVEDFFDELDRAWATRGPRIPLRIIGCGALMLQVDYDRGTKDSDVLETSELDADVKQRLLALAGPTTELRARHQMYLELVPNGLPFLPLDPLWHPVPELRGLRSFDVRVLDVVDVVVSKLKRFHANDVQDVEAMIERDLVPHDRLLARFRAAVDYMSGDASADELPRCVDHLHRVERDMIVVAESTIALPPWVT